MAYYTMRKYNEHNIHLLLLTLLLYIFFQKLLLFIIVLYISLSLSRSCIFSSYCAHIHWRRAKQRNFFFWILFSFFTIMSNRLFYIILIFYIIISSALKHIKKDCPAGWRPDNDFCVCLLFSSIWQCSVGVCPVCGVL